MGRAYRLASVCVPPIWASMAAQELSGAEIPVSSVVGFPYGFVTGDTEAEPMTA
jgi:deoxyribose-phosphate aldolase